jgi:nitrogen fixation NifU-like protein
VSIDELYQALILDHYRRPRNRGPLAGAERAAELYNPLCGDEIGVEVRFEGDRIAECRFHGQGCSISQASASMMTERVCGLRSEEALGLVARVRAMMRGEPAEDLGELAALRGVIEFPVRIKCATLAWSALEAALEGRTGKATTLEP